MIFPPIVYWVIAGGSFWYARHFWVRGQDGMDLAALGAAALFGVGLKHVFKGFKSRDQRYDTKQTVEVARTHTATEGRSSWATRADLKAFGMHVPGRGFCENALWLRALRLVHRAGTAAWVRCEPEVRLGMKRLSGWLEGVLRPHQSKRWLTGPKNILRGSHDMVRPGVELLGRAAKGMTFWLKEKFKRTPNLFIGTLGGKNIYVPTETSLITVAPPGSGKGVSTVIPTLLSYPGSMIVTDPKGELYAVTHRYRRDKLKHRIIVLCPWADMLNEKLGLKMEDHGFNPLAFIRPGMSFKDDCAFVSSLLLPASGHASASDDFWREGGQSLLTGFMMHLFTQDENFSMTLPKLRKAIFQESKAMEEMLVNMAQNQSHKGVIAEIGGKLLGTFQDAKPQFQGWLGTAQKALEIYDGAGHMGIHVSKEDVDFAAMKSVPTTVYIIMPSTHSTTHAAWLNLVISVALERVGRDFSNRRVLFLLDEVGNLGRIPNIFKAIGQYRGQGVQVWCILQSLAQIKQLYGKDCFEQLMATTETISFFGVTDQDTAKYFSQRLGNDTIRNLTYSMSQPQSAADHAAVNCTASDKAAPLLRPDDIITMPADQQIILFRNAKPIKARKLPYFKSRVLKQRADPNPYLKD